MATTAPPMRSVRRPFRRPRATDRAGSRPACRRSDFRARAGATRPAAPHRTATTAPPVRRRHLRAVAGVCLARSSWSLRRPRQRPVRWATITQAMSLSLNTVRKYRCERRPGRPDRAASGLAARHGRDAGPLTAARRAAQQPGPALQGDAPPTTQTRCRTESTEGSTPTTRCRRSLEPTPSLPDVRRD